MLSYEDIPRDLNLAAYFVDGNLEDGRGDHVALVCGERRWTYAGVAELVNRTGHVLRDLGVRPGDRVLIAVNDGIEFVATWYAVLKIGAVVADVYTFLQPKDYAYYLDYTQAPVAVVDAQTLERVREGARLQGGRYLRRIVELEELGALAAQAPAELDPEPTTRDDIAIWKFTTGSTGAPKAAVHCAHDPVVSFHSYALDVVGYRSDDVVLPVPKLFFGYARDATTLFAFGVGATGVVFPERSTPERMFELIDRHRPTILVQVPTMINAMVAHPDAERHDLSCLRLCMSSGEALPAELHRAWDERFGVEVLDGVGSSEAYHIYISNRPGRVRPGSVGQVVPGYEAVVVDPDGRPAPVGEAGELWVKGESAALMYWRDHVKSKRTFAGGDWIHTGDLFARDEDGYFWYRGRADELLKIGGIWVAPPEIERCLLSEPGVVEVAVVGRERDGLVLTCAYVVLSDGLEPTPERAKALQDFVRAHLSPHKYPREVRFVDQLPKTPSGKIDRRALRDAVLEPTTAGS